MVIHLLSSNLIDNWNNCNSLIARKEFSLFTQQPEVGINLPHCSPLKIASLESSIARFKALYKTPKKHQEAIRHNNQQWVDNFDDDDDTAWLEKFDKKNKHSKPRPRPLGSSLLTLVFVCFGHFERVAVKVERSIGKRWKQLKVCTFISLLL